MSYFRLNYLVIKKNLQLTSLRMRNSTEELVLDAVRFAISFSGAIFSGMEIPLSFSGEINLTGSTKIKNQ